jgi:hypothetical protein
MKFSSLEAQKFTLAVESVRGNRDLEFEQHYGAVPGFPNRCNLVMQGV